MAPFHSYSVPILWVPWGALKNLRVSALLRASPRSQKVPAPPTSTHRQGSRGSFGPRASKCVTMHHDAFPFGSLWASLCPRKTSRAAWGLPRLAPRAAANPRFVRSSRDFKRPPRDAVSGLLRLPREAHKIPAFPARAPQTLRNAIPLRGTQGGGVE